MDWEFSFGKEYPKFIEFQLWEGLKGLIGSYITHIESYGGLLVNGSCENKLSEIIHRVIFNIQLSRGLDTECVYSKKLNGSAMLRRIRPEEIERKCRLYFAPTYRKLSSLS